MKNLTNNANAAIKAIVACTAKANAFKTSKTLFLVSIAVIILLFSSCARNTYGCGNGTWACKSSAKNSKQFKSAKFSTSIYKCPDTQRFSR